MMTHRLPRGSEVRVDIDRSDTLRDVKDKLEKATGVPARFQKALLSGIGELGI